ncbi:MAG: stage II sporulation protein M [Firmicutes bacterium]|nr:stage II sporulation protein M [Bacillota bacterium]
MLWDKLKAVLLHRDLAARPADYILPAFCIVSGAVCGWLTPEGCFGAAPDEIGSELESYLAHLPEEGLVPGRELLAFLKWNGGLLLALMLSGLYAVGPAFTLALIFLRGFSFAFSDYYLACAKSPAAASLLAASIPPQVLALLVCLRGARAALDLCRARRQSTLPQRKGQLYKEYFASFLTCLPALLLAAFSHSRLLPLALALFHGAG